MCKNLHTGWIILSSRLAIAIVLLLGGLRVSGGQQVLDLAESPVDALKQAPGKVLVLVFVRTNCPISNRYAPFIQELSAKYAHDAGFLLVFPDKDESTKQIRDYEREYGYKLAAVRDPQHELVKRCQVKVTPEVAVFDANRELVYHGRIDNLYKEFGRARRAATTHELADAIEAARKGRTPTVVSADGIGCFLSDVK